ncbi:hypothetical protein ACRRTK_024723 [Alexandromys fortis]
MERWELDSLNSQFLQHGGPRGPSVPPGMNPSVMGEMMGPSGLSSMAMNPTRAAGMTPLYERLPQHGYPGPPQAQPLPQQGIKRAYSEVYPGQQYQQGGQYAASTAQYAPGPGQSPGPASSYPGHRLPLQQGMAPSLSAPGSTGLHYKPTEKFNGQGPSFNGGSISYGQPGLSGEVKSPFLPDLKPGLSSLHPSSSENGPCDELRLTFSVRDRVVLEPFRLQHKLAVSNHVFQLRDSVYKTLMLRPDLELRFKSYHHEDQQMNTNWPASVQVSVNATHPSALSVETTRLRTSPSTEARVPARPQHDLDHRYCLLLVSPLSAASGSSSQPVVTTVATYSALTWSHTCSSAVSGGPGGSLCAIRRPCWRNSDYEEITFDPTCSWKPVPMKPDLHVKEEPDGPVPNRCRTPPLAPAPSDYPSQGSNFLGPGTFPGSFPSATPTTPNLAEFTQGPPPMSYQSDIPGSLLTADKSAPCLPGQMAPAGHRDPAHNPGPPGLHTPNLGPTPGSQLHHPNPPSPS